MRSQALYGCLLENFAITPQQDWPLAPLCALTQASSTTSFAYLLHWAHVDLRGDQFALYPLRISASEQSDLLESLNQHFQSLAYQFLPYTGDTAVLCMPQPLAVKTFPLAQVAGKDVRQFSATGEQAIAWRSLMNEVQMLLHSHPLNQQREQQNLPAINSIWLDYGGSLPKLAQARKTLLMGEMLQGLALASDNPFRTLPSHLALDDLPDDTVISINADALTDEACWQTFWCGLQSGKLKQLTLFIDMGEASLQVKLSPLDIWKMWRREASELQTFWGAGQ